MEYDYATSLPNTRDEKGFDSAPADLSEADPRVSMANFATRLERAHHQELSVSRRIGKNNMQVAVFSDRVANTALIGTGEVTAAGGFLLPDVYSGTFTYAGDTLDARGLRVVLERKFCSDLTATLDYAYGGVLDLAKPDVELQDAAAVDHHAAPSCPGCQVQRDGSSARIPAGSRPIAGSTVRR